MKPGDLVRIVDASEPWEHLINKVGVFISYDGSHDVYECLVRIVDHHISVCFAEHELDILANVEELRVIFEEENIETHKKDRCR